MEDQLQGYAKLIIVGNIAFSDPRIGTTKQTGRLHTHLLLLIKTGLDLLLGISFCS